MSNEFVDFLKENKAIIFGDFILKSGRKSNYMINIGEINSGSAIKKLGEFYAEKIISVLPDLDNIIIFGSAYKGIPIAVSVSEALSENHGIKSSYLFNRKETKDHGEGGIFVGKIPEDSDKIIIVDDVLTAGTALKESLKILDEYKNQIILKIVAVDREESDLSDEEKPISIIKKSDIFSDDNSNVFETETEPLKAVNIYADGGCRNNQGENNVGGYGVIIEFSNDKYVELKGSEKNTTNNKMELTALVEGLKKLISLNIKTTEVNIFSDSSYVINCFKNEWHIKWKQNGWKTSAKEPVKNKELWEELLGLISKIKAGASADTEVHLEAGAHIEVAMTHTEITFNLVKGHVNNSSEIQKGYASFVKHNYDISKEEYLKIAEMNNRADELANFAMDEV